MSLPFVPLEKDPAGVNVNLDVSRTLATDVTLSIVNLDDNDICKRFECIQSF